MKMVKNCPMRMNSLEISYLNGLPEALMELFGHHADAEKIRREVLIKLLR